MESVYLHEHPDFESLLGIVEMETGISAMLIEKDYWIMHCLYGLKKQGYLFQLKGGTSLSKGYNIIDRFSEDIDLHINPPEALGINENPKNGNSKNTAKKKEYYNQLARDINIPGILSVERDTAFDDVNRYNSGGIRLNYPQATRHIEGVKRGILLEAGFDNVAPNAPVTISSWAFEKAREVSGINLKDNRALDILCYDPRYTFVEKLQTIATKFRKELETGNIGTNYMRQYYDVYCLLGKQEIIDFLGTEAYLKHKELRFPVLDFKVPIYENEAFLLSDEERRLDFKKRYGQTVALYYKGQPSFEDLLSRIQDHIERM